MIYKSKIGVGIALPIGIILSVVAGLMIYERVWPGLGIILLLGIFITHLFATTRYEIDEIDLKVKCGFFYNRIIPLSSITQVKETRNPISSPATSLDRLFIRYNKYDSIIISPKDKQAFIIHLKQINPSIEVTYNRNDQPNS